jgi:hypothetical protein
MPCCGRPCLPFDRPAVGRFSDFTRQLVGCTATEDYRLGQQIDMGPYSFEVVGAETGRWSSTPTINISFRLNRDDTLPFTTDFQSSFGYKMELVDAAGNAFPVEPRSVSPVTRNGRQRSNQYRAEVRLSPSHEGVRDRSRIGKAVGDFTLIIDNPAREGNQPRRVAIPLQ